MFKVNRAELSQTLEIILETQDLVVEGTEASLLEGDCAYDNWAKSSGVTGQGSTLKQEIEDWLLLLQRFPLEGDYILSDQQAYFIMEHYS